MKTINNTTKKAQHYISWYRCSYICDIREVYNSPSAAKLNAQRECRIRMIENDGSGFKILGYNSMTFTAAYRLNNGLCVETKDYTYFIPNVL